MEQAAQDTPPGARHWIAWLARVPTAAVAGLFVAGTLVRWDFAHEISRMLDCQACLLQQSVLHELPYLLGVLALHQLSRWLRQPALGMAIRAALLLALLILLVDVVVFKQFMVRFHWQELRKFAGEFEAAQDFVAQALGQPGPTLAWAGLALGLLALAGQYVRRPAPGRRAAWHWLWPLGAGALILPWQQVHFHTPYVENSLRAFTRAQTRLQPYGQAHTPAPTPAPTPAEAHNTSGLATFTSTLVPTSAPRCTAGQGQRASVILLVVESLSVFHSRALGGLNDWTPELDRLLPQGLLVRDFHANGINTEDGLVALLAGVPPVPPPHTRGVLAHTADESAALPRALQAQGYHSAFLTTGNLGFMDKRAWLHGIGFDEVEGHEHPHYQGLARFHFDAAPDQALYERAAQWLARPPGRPFFLTLETVSTHQPYRHPQTDERSLASVVRYADTQLGRFVQQLQASGYLAQGYLMVVGDHRSMVPLSAGERRALGERAYGRVPLLVLGPGLAGQQVAGPFSQTDLAPSLRQLTGRGPLCLSPGQGVFWPQALQPPDCVLTRRPYDLDTVVVACGAQDHPVRLNAEATAYTGQPGPPEWLTRIHRFRLGLGW